MNGTENIDIDLGFSTNWNVRSHNNGRDVIEEIKSLGFKKVELNYRVKEEMLRDIYPMVEKGEIEVCSIHNVFPKVDGNTYDTDSMLLGYTDEEKRKTAVELTKRSTDYAERFGAVAVVIHPGIIPVGKDYDTLLKRLYAECKRYTDEYRRLFSEMMTQREAGSRYYTDLIVRSLEEVCNHLAKRNYRVKLAIENRAICNQIPDFREAGMIMEKLEGMPVYFWYDIGHGIMMENLGMFNNLEGATALKDRIIGMHLHDASGVDDHWCPYTFGDGFDRFLDLIADSPVKVYELGPKCKREDIIKSARLLSERLKKKLKNKPMK